MLNLSQRLRELRECNHYTQEYVSTKINIERPSYSNYELGKRTPSIEILIAVAEFYHISLDDLLINPDFSPYAAAREDSRYILLNQKEISMLSIYRTLPAKEQKECEDYIQYKKDHL